MRLGTLKGRVPAGGIWVPGEEASMGQAQILFTPMNKLANG
jgi:hypothetical protein